MQGAKKVFKDRPFQERKSMSQMKSKQAQNCIPIVLQPGKYSQLTASSGDKRFTVQKNLKVIDLIRTFHLDKKLSQKSSQGFYLFTVKRKEILKNQQTIQQVYKKHKDQDGWLYLQYDMTPVF